MREKLQAILVEWRDELVEYERLADVAGARGDTIMQDRYLDTAEIKREDIAQLEVLLREAD